MKIIKDILFYILSFTWGILMSTLGLVVSLFLLITGHRPDYFHNRIYFKVGKRWGGLELGCIFLTDSSPTLHLLQHEAGHGIQNIIFGPLVIFISFLPSAIRYWLREMETQKSKYIYTSILCIVICIIGIGLITLGYFFCKALIWIGTGITIYGIIIFMWLVIREIPKYANNAYVPYDGIWFEAQATRLGEKNFSKEN